MKRINTIIFSITIFLLGSIVSADLQIYRNIKYTVGYMSKMLFTTDGTSLSPIKVSIDATTGNINLSGDIKIGNKLCLGGVCKTSLDSIWGTNGSNIYYNGGSIGIGLSSPSSKLAIKSSGDGYGILIQANTNTNTVARLVQNNTDDGRLYLYSTNSIKTDINSNGNSFFNGGNLGILNTAPGATVSIGGSQSVLAGTTNTFSTYIYNDSSGIGHYDVLTNSTSNTSFQLRTYNNGTYNTALYAKYDGNVGIGTTNPGYKLDVNDAGTTAMIRITQADSTLRYNGLRLDRTGNIEKWFIGMDNYSNNLLFRKDGTTNSVVITTGGVMGIGTYSPLAGLDVEATPTNGPFLKVNYFTIDSTQGYGLVNLIAGAKYSGATSGHTYISTRGASRIAMGDGTLQFLLGTGNTLGVAGKTVAWKEGFYNDNSQIRLGYGGLQNVGIGMAPGYKLDVAGDIRANGRIRASGVYGFLFNDYGGGFYMSDANRIRGYGNQGLWMNNGRIGGNGGLSIGYGGSGGTNAGGGAIIAGNVGIGNTSPAYKLDVTGQINTTGGLCIAGDCKTAWSQVSGGSTAVGTLVGVCSFSNGYRAGSGENSRRVEPSCGTAIAPASCSGGCSCSAGYTLRATGSNGTTTYYSCSKN